MKSKIFTAFALLVSLSIIYTTMSSSSGGKYNNGTSCGSCHGSSATTATVVSLTGLPATFITGQTYPLVFTVTNSGVVGAPTPKGGFNVKVSGGTLVAGTGSQVSGTQITHNGPMALTSGTATFNFSWTAPTTTTAVTFNAVGMIVNGDGNDASSDKWNTTNVSVPGSFPTDIKNISSNKIQCYPNPTTDKIIIDGFGDAKNIKLISVSGEIITPNYIMENSKCVIDCSTLSAGKYIVHALLNEKTVVTSFLKK